MEEEFCQKHQRRRQVGETALPGLPPSTELLRSGASEKFQGEMLPLAVWQPLKPAILVFIWDPGEGCILGLKSVWQTSFYALGGQLHCLANWPVTHTEKLVPSPIFG